MPPAPSRSDPPSRRRAGPNAPRPIPSIPPVPPRLPAGGAPVAGGTARKSARTSPRHERTERPAVARVAFTATAPATAPGESGESGESDEHAVDHDVEDEDAGPQHPLPLAGQSRRVEQWPQIVIDETPGVTGLADGLAEVILQRGQRTQPAGEFDPRPPPHRRQVEPNQSRPAPNPQAAERHEQDEPQVEQRHRGGGPAQRERHRSSASRVARRIVAGGPAHRPPLPHRRH